MKIKRKIKELDKLPSTRKRQFKDILKYDFALVVDISILQGLFTIPLIVLFIIQINILTSLSELSFELVFPVMFYFSLIEIVFFGIRNISRSATCGIMIKRIYNEGCFIIPTFYQKLKENGLKSFFMGFIEGLCFAIFVIVSTYLLYLPIKPVAQGLAIGMLALLFMFSFLTLEYFNNFINVYELRFKDLIKNSYSLVFLTLFASLLYFVLVIIVPFSLILISRYLMILVIMINCLFYDGFSQLISSLYAINKFDKYINKDNYPDYVGKGLSKKEEN